MTYYYGLSDLALYKVVVSKLTFTSCFTYLLGLLLWNVIFCTELYFYSLVLVIHLMLEIMSADFNFGTVLITFIIL